MIISIESFRVLLSMQGLGVSAWRSNQKPGVLVHSQICWCYLLVRGV